jgi:dihydropteroate synthase
MDNNTALPRTIKLQGQLLDLEKPVVMGILNVTPDSFYANSRVQTDADIANRALQMVNDGAAIIDVGGYSSRPGAEDISEHEEIKRLDLALTAIRKILPTIPLSVDTFRSGVAKHVVDNFRVDIINDISGGMADNNMFSAVGKLNVAYVVMHMVGTPQNMQQNPQYNDVVKDVTLFLAQQYDKLTYAGVTDIIIDPGFGFGKTVAHNYELLDRLEEFKLFNAPILAGISRKSMIHKPLNITANEALNGTTVLNTIALTKGANILRVHDVKEAVECIKLITILQASRHGVSGV